MTRILFLGAAPHQAPAIHYARERGYETFTTDNRPENPGHALAHRAFGVNAADAEAVAALARSMSVDAVIGYASEVCAVTAARVATALGLPTPPLEAVLTLARKDRFRRLLCETGIQPLAWAVFPASEADDALAWARSRIETPGVVVKPVDTSGSKGVTVRPAADTWTRAFHHAAAASPDRRVIVEEFVGRSGSQFTGDGFVEAGRLRFFCPMDNRTVPGIAHPAIFQERAPSEHPAADMRRLRRHLERIIRVAGYTRGPFNIDGIFRHGGEPFLIEVAPRNGGNFIPHAIRHHTGVDLLAAAVESAVDPAWRLPPGGAEKGRGFHACYMLHSMTAGRFAGVDIDPSVRPHVLEETPYLRPGDEVRPFLQANAAAGNLVLGFDSAVQMRTMMDRMAELCRVRLEGHP